MSWVYTFQTVGTDLVEMKKIGVIAKPHNPETKKVVEELIHWLRERDREVFLDAATGGVVGEESVYLKSQIPPLVDIIIVLGGDGTLLSVARLVEGKGNGVPILGVNLGGLGFITEVMREELYPTLEKVFKNEFISDERMILQSVVYRQGEQVVHSYVLNDVVVSKGTLSRLIKVEVYIDKIFVTSMRGDGLIVSTPTGSTAYSLSAGGPILHPSVEALTLTPISPHTLTNRPIVIPDRVKVEVILKTRDEGVTVTFDGQVGFSLRQDDVVEIEAAEKKIALIRSPEKNYFETLRKKLKWGEE